MGGATDAAESEKRYRALFEESRDAIYISSRDGAFLEVNQAAVELFGYTREELLGMNVLALYAVSKDRDRFQQEIERHGAVRDYELRLRRKNGADMICLVTATVRKNADEEIVGYQGIIRDITDGRHVEQELLKMEKLECVGILAGGIAHDFNNILTAILGNISLAKMLAKPKDRLFECLTAAEAACYRARDLTRQLLTFSKGGAPVRMTSSIIELLEDAARSSCRGSKVRCELAAPAGLWPVAVDEGQLHQVISSLLSNAGQAMPEGGVVRLTAENVTVEEKPGMNGRAGNYVRISVSDQGCGIPEEHLAKIFDPYFTTKEMGSGLGLAVTYSVIKKHDGFVDVRSVPGKGTTFHLYLPATETRG